MSQGLHNPFELSTRDQQVAGPADTNAKKHGNSSYVDSSNTVLRVGTLSLPPHLEVWDTQCEVIRGAFNCS